MENSELKTLLQDYATYNAWANGQLIEWLKTQPKESMETEIPSSFPSIQKTLVHLWSSEKLWLSVMQHKEAPVSMDDTYQGTIDEVFDGLSRQSLEVETFVKSLSLESLAEECTWSTPWFSTTKRKFEFIQHCVNHSTYHRGQLITISRNLDFTDQPMTDFTAFLISKDSTGEQQW